MQVFFSQVCLHPSASKIAACACATFLNSVAPVKFSPESVAPVRNSPESVKSVEKTADCADSVRFFTDFFTL